MSCEEILQNNNSEFPFVEGYDLRSVDTELFNRIYSEFISRLQRSGFNFPAVSVYRNIFGIELQSSFLFDGTRRSGYYPAVGQKWLVFVEVEGEPVRLYVARYIVGELQCVVLYGRGPRGMVIELGADVRVRGVGVPVDHIQSMGLGGVVLL